MKDSKNKWKQQRSKRLSDDGSALVETVPVTATTMDDKRLDMVGKKEKKKRQKGGEKKSIADNSEYWNTFDSASLRTAVMAIEKKKVGMTKSKRKQKRQKKYHVDEQTSRWPHAAGIYMTTYGNWVRVCGCCSIILYIVLTNQHYLCECRR